MESTESSLDGNARAVFRAATITTIETAAATTGATTGVVRPLAVKVEPKPRPTNDGHTKLVATMVKR
jgi:hypothetical protein